MQTSQQETVYTPQFFVAGRELRSWREDLRTTVRAVNSRPISTHAGGVVLGDHRKRSRRSVKHGENGGRILAHEHVVHTWIGPLALTQAGHSERRTLPLQAHWQRAALDVTVFVQDPRTGDVLQALRAQHCAAS